jgi:hypothetical protein
MGRIVVPWKETGMNFHRRRSLRLFAAGVALLLVGSWILQITLPPRSSTTLPRIGPRKMVRILPPAPQKRSDCGHEGQAIAWTLHGYSFTDSGPGRA